MARHNDGPDMNTVAGASTADVLVSLPGPPQSSTTPRSPLHSIPLAPVVPFRVAIVAIYSPPHNPDQASIALPTRRTRRTTPATPILPAPFHLPHSSILPPPCSHFCPNGQPIYYTEQSPPPSVTGHGSFYYPMSVDETGVYRNSNAANRASSTTSFAPPPAPWMPSESRVSMASTGARDTITPKKRPPHPSALLKGPIEKPWLTKKDPWATASWWITVGLFFLGVAGSAVLVFFGIRTTPKLGKICQVMHDDFNSLDTSLWQLESELGGFGNGEFEMTTQTAKNAFTDSGKLYIVPTLTEDEIGSKVYDGGTYTLDKCTTNNRTACTAASSETRKVVINPVQTARMNTKGVATIG
jgi:hypothetical protein